MSAEIVLFFPQLLNQCPECGIPVKVSCQEKGGFDLLISQHVCDNLTPISKSITSKYQRYSFFRQVSSNNGPMVIGQRFFFTGFVSLSWAASR